MSVHQDTQTHQLDSLGNYMVAVKIPQLSSDLTASNHSGSSPDFNFDLWAIEVRRQMLASIKKREQSGTTVGSRRSRFRR